MSQKLLGSICCQTISFWTKTAWDLFPLCPKGPSCCVSENLKHKCPEKLLRLRRTQSTLYTQGISYAMSRTSSGPITHHSYFKCPRNVCFSLGPKATRSAFTWNLNLLRLLLESHCCHRREANCMMGAKLEY